MPEAFADRIEEGIYQILAYVPQLAMALGILIAGFAVAKIVERGTQLALQRVGFDRWMREGGVTEALERAGTGLDPSGVLAKLVFWILMLLVILLASDALGLDVVTSLFAELLAYIPNVITAVIILVLGLVIGEFVKNLVLASAGAVPGVPTLARSAKGAVIILTIFMALGQLGVAEDMVLVAFVAVVGAAALAAGIAFGLGARDVAGEITRAWYERSRVRPRAVRRGEPGAEPRTGTEPETAAGAEPEPPARAPDPADRSEDEAPGEKR